MRRPPLLIAACLGLLVACGTDDVEVADSAAGATAASAAPTPTSGPAAPTSTSGPAAPTSTSGPAGTVPRAAESTTTSTTTTTTTTTTAPLPTDLALDAEGVPVNGQTRGVVVAPDGWVLPVLGPTATGWRVWTPCGRVADVTAGTFVDGVDVVLDPGHGGSESGAVGPAGTVEADLNLQVAERIRRVLEAAGHTVLLTRTSDVRVPIVTRAEIALALEPRAFLSVHHNAGTDAPSPTPGTEMFFQVADPDSRRLAGLLYEETRAVLDGYDADWVAMADAGAMPRLNREGGDYYGVLRRPAGVTSVLLEFAYIANASEESLLVRDDVQDGLARAVGRAVERLLTTTEPGSGYTEDPIFRGYASSGTGRTTNCTDPDLS